MRIALCALILFVVASQSFAIDTAPAFEDRFRTVLRQWQEHPRFVVEPLLRIGNVVGRGCARRRLGGRASARQRLHGGRSEVAQGFECGYR